MDEQRWARALARLDADQLARLLTQRPDVAGPFPPADLDELAERLTHPRSIATALRGFPLPHLQLLEAALAIRSPCSLDELGELLADGAAERTRVDAIVDDLAELLVVLREGDTIVLPDAFDVLFETPLGLGRPMVDLLEHATVAELQRIQRSLGLPLGRKRAETLQSVLDFFARPDGVAALIAAAPPAVRTLLLDANSDDLDYGYRAFNARMGALEWAIERGLIVGYAYGGLVDVPAEVTRAVRGPGYRAPFAPHPPPVAVREVDAGRVQRDSAAAASAYSALALAVLDRIAHTPVPTVKSGGVGTRELTKLAKALDADESDVRLALELAGANGLLAADGGRLGTTPGFVDARNAPPAQLLAAQLATWWVMGAVPSVARDGEGKALRALEPREDCAGCWAARRGLVETSAAATGSLDAPDLAALVLWRHPLADNVEAQDVTPFATTIREAEQLGVFAAGSVSPLGRALLADDPDLLLAAAAAVLPAATEHAVLGSDLTAFVAGMPSGRVSALLDSAADRESRGGAITWRFSPGSVRRALDDGITGTALLGQLGEIADGELPQALRYLIGDIARQHGHLRLSDALSVIRSEDSALLEIVARDRTLAKHGVRLLAPTVLAADVPADVLLAALRRAGYYPVLENPVLENEAPAAPVAIRPARAPATRPAARPDVHPAPDPTTLARDLLQAPRASSTPPSVTERRLTPLADGLNRAEIRLLAHAIDTGSPVRLDYLSSTGAQTSRVIRRPELLGGSISAWCDLRSDERFFTVSRILRVAPG